MKKIHFTLLLLTAAALMAGCGEHAAEQPRNLIYMIGDGMGLSHVSMLQIEGGYAQTAFDRMENIALTTSYSANNRVTDSAAAGTALATGTKTNNSMLGMSPDSLPHQSILMRAREQGLATGFVVTCEVQHATPGAFYAHVPYRGDYASISRQLATAGLDVIAGGGSKMMTTPDEENPEQPTPLEQLQAAGYQSVATLEELESVAQTPVVALLAEGHLPSMLRGRGDYLPRAVRKSLSLLEAQGREQGFMLMVEGSQIDFESHGNNTEGILAEVRDFEAAVREAMAYVDAHPETLLVVTSDHETGGMAIASGHTDFTRSESGIDYRYGTTSHTGIALPVYLYGCGAEQINGFIDNAELGRRLMAIMGLTGNE